MVLSSKISAAGVLGAILFFVHGVEAIVPKFGHESCRCSSSPNPNLPTNVLMDEFGLTVQEANTYGVGCASHDTQTAACQQVLPDPPADCQGLYPVPGRCKPPERPSWCDKMWCYIANETECNLIHSESPTFPGKDIYYSYASCGERDLFSSNPLENALRDEILSVAYRVNSGGWLGSYHPSGYKNQVPMVRDDQWYGMLPKLVDEFAKSSGAIINMTEAPLWVYDAANFSSDFTNCAHAVSLGMLDFCTGLFTITTERAIMTNFHTIETTPLYMVVRQEEEAALYDRIFRAFKPFTFGAWTCVLVVLLTSSFILFCQETLPGGKHFKKDAIMRERSILSRMASSAYFGLQGFFSGDVGRDYSTWEGRGTAVGIGFFVMIILSMYTANLTTLLVAEASKTSLSGIDDAIHHKVPICIRDSALKLVNNLYPKADWKMIRGKLQLIEAIASGECKAGLSYLEDLEVLQSRGEYCELTQVGLPVVNAYRGIPLNPLKTKVLTYHFQKIINEGAWNDLKQNGLQNQCQSTSHSEGGHSLQFDAFDLIGISVICAVITAIFGLLSATRWRRLSSSRKDQASTTTSKEKRDPTNSAAGEFEVLAADINNINKSFNKSRRKEQALTGEEEQDSTNSEEDIEVPPAADINIDTSFRSIRSC